MARFARCLPGAAPSCTSTAHTSLKLGFKCDISEAASACTAAHCRQRRAVSGKLQCHLCSEVQTQKRKYSSHFFQASQQRASERSSVRNPICRTTAAHMSSAQSGADQQAARKLRRRDSTLAQLHGAPQLTCLTFNVLADGLAQEGGFIRVRGVATFPLTMGSSKQRKCCSVGQTQLASCHLEATRREFWHTGTSSSTTVGAPAGPAAGGDPGGERRHRVHPGAQPLP